MLDTDSLVKSQLLQIGYMCALTSANVDVLCPPAKVLHCLGPLVSPLIKRNHHMNVGLERMKRGRKEEGGEERRHLVCFHIFD